GRALEGAVPAPAGDVAVVAGGEDLGDCVPTPVRRFGVDGVLEEACGTVRLLDERLGVADDAGQQPGHRLDHHECGDLPAVEDVVPDRDLADDDAWPAGVVLGDARVDALVPAAGDDEASRPGELLRGPLGEHLAT